VRHELGWTATLLLKHRPMRRRGRRSLVCACGTSRCCERLSVCFRE